MSQQEIKQVEVIAVDAFRSAGELVKKDSPFKCTEKTAKELVAVGKARYPEEEKTGEGEDKAPASSAKKTSTAKS